MPLTRRSSFTPIRSASQMRPALALIVTLPFLAACDSPTAISDLIRFGGRQVETRTIDTTCETMRPITWTDADTDQTIREVKAHNAVFVALCPNA